MKRARGIRSRSQRKLKKQLYLEGLEDRRLLAGDGAIVDTTTIEHPARYTLFGPNLSSPESQLFHPKTDVQYTVGQNSSYQVNADIRLNEDENIDSGFINNIPADAQLIPLGFDDNEDDAIDIRGELLEIEAGSAAVSREDDGSILTANEISVTPGIPVTITATIGDQTVGFNDADFFELLEVQPGQLITASVTGALDSAVLIYDSAGNLLASNDDLSFSNFDSFVAYTALEADDYYVAVIGTTGIGFFEPSDPYDANTVGPGFVGPYELTVGVDATDADYYSFELEPGDIFGVNARGGVNHLSLLAPDGSLLVGSAQDLASQAHPLASPLPSGGVAALSWVIDTPGTYYLQALGTREGRYQLETRLFRPVLEQQPPGAHQILFLDFDGAAINTEIFGSFGIARLSPMSDFMRGWDLSNQDALIDRIVGVARENFISDMRNISNNPNSSIQILNSRDHADPFGQPNVSRVIVGGTITELGIGTIGIAQSVDVGNFETEETAVVLLDLLSDSEFNPNSLNQYPVAPGASKYDLVAAGVGNIVVHEAGHFFGGWHTNQFNDTSNIMDQGGNLPGIVGVGEDRVWGTQDDVDVDFAIDQFVMNENFFGMQNTLNAIAFGISAGSADLTTRATGVKWNDLNGDGLRDSGEPGIGGVRVYVDVNGDDVFGIGEPVGITAADGRYVIRGVPTGQFAVREVVQPGWEETFPVEGEHLITFRATREVTGLDFGNQRGEGADSGVDYSDAPASYGVATHNVVPGLSLGELVDGDPGPIVNDGIDNDGVELSELVVGETATAVVTVFAGNNPPALVQGWVDFDRNGQFDANEQIIRDAAVSEGENSFSFEVPPSAFPGDTYTRFRYGYERGIGPTGAALAGEVEDYGETIETTGGGIPQGPDAVDDSRTVNQGSSGEVIEVLDNDLVAEGKTLFVASVGTPSAGGSAVRSADEQSIVYSPASGFVGTETFTYTASDGSLTDTAVVTVTVDPVIVEDNLVQFRLQPTDANGQPINQVTVGSDFELRVFVEDLQDVPSGVFAGYLDIEYDAGLASVNGTLQYGDSYENGRSGNTSLPGFIDEAGAFDGFTELGGGEFLLVSVPMQAVTEGTLVFASNPADVSPNHDVLLFGGGDPIADEQIDYQTGAVTIVTGIANALFTNPSGAMDVNNDGQVSPIDALTVINELNANGPRVLGLSAAPVAGVFVDVSGDNFISSIDALLVINYLNDAARRAEGENVTADARLTMTTSGLATVARQVARSQLSDVVLAQAAAEAQLMAHQADESDDDLESLLGVIADDIVRAS